MEDAATAEIARVQLWQWVKYAARMNNGQPVTVPFVDQIIEELAATIKSAVPGVKDEHLKITIKYSDLMPFLSMADGVELRWQPSLL